VEEALRRALVSAGILTAANAERLEQKAGWSRSSRTDSGVSANRLTVCAKLLVHEETLDAEGYCQALVEELNDKLPSDI